MKDDCIIEIMIQFWNWLSSWFSMLFYFKIINNSFTLCQNLYFVSCTFNRIHVQLTIPFFLIFNQHHKKRCKNLPIEFYDPNYKLLDFNHQIFPVLSKVMSLLVSVIFCTMWRVCSRVRVKSVGCDNKNWNIT